MSQSKDDRAKQFAKRKRTLLPEKGQGSDAETDFTMNIVSTLLEAVYEMLMCVARPLWALVTYVCYEAWVEKKTPPPKKK